MQPKFVESRRQITGKRESVTFYTRLPHMEDENHPMEACYRQGAEALEQYIREVDLPKLEAMLDKTARKNRLHRMPPTVSYICQGDIEKDRYWSIGLKLCRTDSSGSITAETYRVWDLQTGRLCPIEEFVPYGIAKHYRRWEFALRQGSIWAMPKRQRRGTERELMRMENRKK